MIYKYVDVYIEAIFAAMINYTSTFGLLVHCMTWCVLATEDNMVHCIIMRCIAIFDTAGASTQGLSFLLQ